MALPPEPLAEILPIADAVFFGEVVRVLEEGAPPAPSTSTARPRSSDTVGGGLPAPMQRVEVRVDQILREGLGVVVGEAVVLGKPPGAYALRAGVRGPFLIRRAGERSDPPSILGRYGPDTWRLEAIEAHLVPEPRDA